MIRALSLSDTSAAVALLRRRPLHNVFLEYVVASGVLGLVPGFVGWWDRAGELGAVMMVGPLGGTALEVADPDAFAPLAERAAAGPRPRHLVGAADVTEPFWAAYRTHAAKPVWDRIEVVHALGETRRAAAEQAAAGARVEVARREDLDEIVLNSARQHVEDLRDDRMALDPRGFRERHARDVREGRWWVLRERGRIVCQLHVGAENGATIQIGGVATPPDLRERGFATRCVAAAALRLLERRPCVSLFCHDANAAALRVYARVGFEPRLRYHSWLLDEPVSTSV